MDEQQNTPILEELKNRKKDFLGVSVGVLGLLSIYLIVLIVSSAIGIGKELNKGENTLVVAGSGEVYTKPDLALVDFTVVTEAKTVETAMSNNTKYMNAVIAAVKSQGVEEKDLKTAGFNIYPRYEWQDKTSIPPYYEGKRVLAGYEMRQTLSVKIRNMEKVGAVIEEATKAGANEIGSLQFIVENEDELKKQARKEAIAEAKAKAEELASQLGVKLVRISNFNESGISPIFYKSADSAVGMGGGSPDIETGENKIEVDVTLTYEIK